LLLNELQVIHLNQNPIKIKPAIKLHLTQSLLHKKTDVCYEDFQRICFSIQQNYTNISRCTHFRDFQSTSFS
ncbi:unnamed protein product, partial [Musa textilis]